MADPPPVAGRLLCAGLAMATAAGVVLAAAVARSGDILDARGRVLLLLGGWSAAWALGVVCALRVPGRVVIPVVLVGAVAIRLAALSGPPTLSDDLYRYSWDGRVQAAGINPYRYPPDSPALTQLREPWLWPDAADCTEIYRPSGCSRMNRTGVRTIYPPLAQVWFAGVYRVAGIEARHKAWQVTGVLTELAVVALLPLVLAAWARDRRWTALYALSPFPVVEVVNNGHVDGLAVVLVVLALLAAARRRTGWAGALLGGATLVKLYPAVLLVGLVGGAERRRSALVRAAAGALAVVGAGYAVHVLTVGPRVLGYLPGYLREEQYGEGGRYLLAGLLGTPAPITAALAAAGVLAVVGWVMWRRPPAPQAFAVLLGAALLAATPNQPWYAVTLLAVATVAAQPRWALVAAAAYPLYFGVILDVPHAVAVGQLSYSVALAGVVALCWAERQRRVISRRAL
ncbi:MAG: glycosyltransferase 87 family protein [Actinomycetota bacterium]|nr:glycosyltransferase 87 family protein [Actinomycetota bacterium]